MNHDWCQVEPGLDRCRRCGLTLETTSREQAAKVLPRLPSCTPPQTDMPVVGTGPGDHLHKIILDMFHQGPNGQCGCEDRIAEMNQWGVEGCRQNIETIVNWLIEQVLAHDWTVVEIDPYGNESLGRRSPPLVVRLARLTMKVPGGSTPVRWRCRQLVQLAIRRAERDARKRAAGVTGSRHGGHDVPLDNQSA
jgi:hypothetical protein